MHACIHRCMQSCWILAYIHTYTCIYMHTYIHTRYSYIRTNKYAYILTYMHTCMHTDTLVIRWLRILKRFRYDRWHVVPCTTSTIMCLRCTPTICMSIFLHLYRKTSIWRFCCHSQTMKLWALYSTVSISRSTIAYLACSTCVLNTSTPLPRPWLLGLRFVFFVCFDFESSSLDMGDSCHERPRVTCHMTSHVSHLTSDMTRGLLWCLVRYLNCFSVENVRERDQTSGTDG